MASGSGSPETVHSDEFRDDKVETLDEYEEGVEEEEGEVEYWEEEEAGEGTTTTTTGESGESSSNRTGSMLTPEDDPDDPSFRDYLNRIHFTHSLTQCIIDLYESPERPQSPLEYFLKLLAASSGKAEEHEVAAAPEQDPEEIHEILEKQLADLQMEKQLLNERLDKFRAVISENESEAETEYYSEEETEHFC